MGDGNVGDFLPEGQPQLGLQIFKTAPNAGVLKKADRIIQVEDIEICRRKRDGTGNCAQKRDADAETQRSPVRHPQTTI